jgi:sugar-phosphatase
MGASVKAFCFDMDGTLLDTEIIWVEVVEAFVRERLPAFNRDDALRVVYGRSWRDVYRDVVGLLPDLGMTIEDLLAVMDPMYHDRFRSRDVRIYSSIGLLKRLARESAVCVVSGSTREAVEEGIALMGIGADIRFALSCADYGPGKPDPTCYRLAMSRLGMPAGAGVAFEDSSAGVRAARSAGLRCVALAKPGAPRQDWSPADLVVADLADPAVERFLWDGSAGGWP